MSEIPAGAVTTADLYRELVGMRQDITRALERLAVADSRMTTADAQHADQENRLRALERFRWTLLGAGCSGLSSRQRGRDLDRCRPGPPLARTSR